MIDEPNHAQEASATKQDDHDSGQHPLLTQSNTNQDEPDEDQERAELKRQWEALLSRYPVLKSSSFWTGLATAVIAVATMVYTFYARKQWHVMGDTLSEMQLTERLDQRAWVELDQIKKPYKNSKDLFVYEIFPKNVGKTAAREITTHANNVGQNRENVEDLRHPDIVRNIQDDFLYGKFINSPPLNGGTPVPSVIGPGVSSPIPITYVAQIPQIFPSGAAVVSAIVGRIDYRDEFGVGHWIRYCFYLANADGNLASCAVGNDEDDNPEIQKKLN